MCMESGGDGGTGRCRGRVSRAIARLGQLDPSDRRAVAVFLSAGPEKGGGDRRLTAAEVGTLIGKTESWIRLAALTDACRTACGPDDERCDERCAYHRGRTIFQAVWR